MDSRFCSHPKRRQALPEGVKNRDRDKEGIPEAAVDPAQGRQQKSPGLQEKGHSAGETQAWQDSDDLVLASFQEP